MYGSCGLFLASMMVRQAESLIALMVALSSGATGCSLPLLTRLRASWVPRRALKTNCLARCRRLWLLLGVWVRVGLFGLWFIVSFPHDLLLCFRADTLLKFFEVFL